MLEAKSPRMEARGEAPLDIEAEMAALTAAAGARDDPGCARRCASSWSRATSAGCAAARSRWTWRPRSSASCASLQLADDRI